MKGAISKIVIIIMIESFLMIVYHHLRNFFLDENVAAVFAILYYFIIPIPLLFVGFKWIVSTKGYRENYLKSAFTSFLILFLTLVITRLYWGIVGNNLGTVDWFVSGTIVLILVLLFISFIVAIFFRKSKEE